VSGQLYSFVTLSLGRNTMRGIRARGGLEVVTKGNISTPARS